VFNFDAPWHPDDYVHRIGRTGRAGAKGVAYTFVTAEDAEAIDNIQKLIGQKIETIESPAVTAPAAKEEPRRGGNERRSERTSVKRRDDRRRDEPRPARSEASGSRPRRMELVEDSPDEGWNGPVPEFLSVGFSG
jgi:superfamily II DNA/RNA helicase